jgi:hypothetical protein
VRGVVEECLPRMGRCHHVGSRVVTLEHEHRFSVASRLLGSGERNPHQAVLDGQQELALDHLAAGLVPAAEQDPQRGTAQREMLQLEDRARLALDVGGQNAVVNFAEVHSPGQSIREQCDPRLVDAKREVPVFVLERSPVRQAAPHATRAAREISGERHARRLGLGPRWAGKKNGRSATALTDRFSAISAEREKGLEPSTSTLARWLTGGVIPGTWRGCETRKDLRGRETT